MAATQGEVTAYVPQWTFADKLRKARLSVGLAQIAFAEKLGVSAPAYAQWEAGRSNPRNVVQVARRVEAVTRVSAAWLLGLYEEGPRPAERDRDLQKYTAWDLNPEPTD
ncbi:helix-turn-helix domain-containing protein [Georgenia sp. EYE_87]|uniref:helix-turn-helix domain-containing protein n=1 Tax=Georgenia sp. EYE_87 TaxID=2853448 RepID=UPI0035A9154F|nr:helix-turn-helix domain-containing protein [Georgenia sp. EYE_87]